MDIWWWISILGVNVAFFMIGYWIGRIRKARKGKGR